MAAENYAFVVFSFVGFVLTFFPFPWHWKGFNTGICIFRFWNATWCLILFIDAIIWNNNFIDRAPVWCAIVAHYSLGETVGMSAASLVIVRNLYSVVSLKPINMSETMPRRTIYIDLGIGFGLSVAQIVIGYCIGGPDYSIYEDQGCTAVILITPLSMALIFCWPLGIGVISLVYGCLIIRACAEKYTTLRAVFSAPNASYYFRLMAVSVTQMLTIPLSAYFIWSDALALSPWPGWAKIHAQFSDIQTISVIWTTDPSAELRRWSAIITAMIYFALIGLGKDGWMKYRRMFDWMIRGRGRPAPANVSFRASILPYFLTISLGSRPGPSQSILQPLAIGDFRPAAPPENAVGLAPDSLEPNPGASGPASQLALPKPTHPPSSRSALNGADEWTPELLYEHGTKRNWA